MSRQHRWRTIGLVGTGVTALCCFTPLLVWLLGVVGLTSILAYLDFVLLPLLGLFLIILAASFLVRPKAEQ